MMSRAAAPPKPGEMVRVAIEDLSSRGWGVGRTAEGMVVMVPLTVPGDEIEARVRIVHPSHLEADTVAVVHGSPDRTVPFCVHFGVCGGCVLQQMPAEAQRRAKTERLRRLLKKFAGLTGGLVDEAVQVGPDTGFRNRMEFALGSGTGGARMGLHDTAGNVFDLTECHLPHPDVVRLALRIRERIRQYGLPVADPGERMAGLSGVDIRRSGAGDVLVALRARGDLSGDSLAPLAALVDEPDGPKGVVLTGLRRAHPETIRLFPVVHPQAERPVPADEKQATAGQRAGSDRGSGRDLSCGAGTGNGFSAGAAATTSRQVLAGVGEIREEILGLQISVTEETFIQTHLAGAAALYTTALDWLAHAPAAAFLDLYAGLGLLAQAAAPGRKETVAVESERAAVEAGRRAARLNHRAVRFECEQAHRAAHRLAGLGRRFPMAVANPPRAGLHRSLPAALRGLGVRRLAYISCDPATLARDLARLGQVGLVVRRITPFDLFPHTAGLEAVALLER